MRAILITVLLGLFPAALAQSQSAACLDCHLDDQGSPMHAMLSTRHGGVSQSCEACHGPSGDHMSRPTVAAPDISFGPRWSATPAQQDSQCLDCHKTSVASHWNEALHMANNVTCVSCHDLHVEQDPVLASGGQIDVCTTCHKTQKTGMHGRESMLRMNPPCTQCHNPHADQHPIATMLANDSQGCRRCHNLKAMAASDKISARAKGFHRAMESGEKTCIDCHAGVAHGNPDAFEPFIPLPRSERQLILFDPGASDADWLISEHPGSQPLRQGSNCRQCHRGEELTLAASLGGADPSSRPVTVGFTTEGDMLVTRLSWKGGEEDTQISLMWGFGDNPALRRGGCWAACHADMRGMSLDKGKDKYLWSALSRRRSIGQPAVFKSAAELQQEMAAGNFAELWSIDLQTQALRVYALLADTVPVSDADVSAAVAFADGRWTAVVRRPSKPSQPLLSLDSGRAYTFGVALHGRDHSGGSHWVSLPMTLSDGRDDTDFITH